LQDLRKSPFTQEFHKKMPQTKTLRTLRRTLRASLRDRNANGNLTKTIYARMHKKNAALQVRDNHSVPASAVEMLHMDFVQESSCENLREKYRAPGERQQLGASLRNQNAII
jgi:hypothetical protein